MDTMTLVGKPGAERASEKALPPARSSFLRPLHDHFGLFPGIYI